MGIIKTGKRGLVVELTKDVDNHFWDIVRRRTDQGDPDVDWLVDYAIELRNRIIKLRMGEIDGHATDSGPENSGNR